MKIEKAAEMGFCFGVRRAIGIVEKSARERGPIQTLGPLVHNKQVVARLMEHNVSVAHNLDKIQGSIVAIPSHGVGPDVIKQLKTRKLEIVDATCPFVRKAQVVAQRLGKEGFSVLVFGDASHPEVQAVLGWAGTAASASLEVSPSIVLPTRLGVLCQTTQNQERFANFVSRIISSNLIKYSELRIFNTICDATRKHQAAALELAKKADLMIVIGSRDSANTKRLAELCAESGVITRHIETAAEFNPSWLRGQRLIGVTAGASTPDEVIDEVVLKIKRSDNKNSNEEDIMQQEKFGIYLNSKKSQVMRINSPYWIPKGAGWVFLTPEVNTSLLKIRELAKEKGLVKDPENIVWGDWSQVPKRR